MTEKNNSKETPDKIGYNNTVKPTSKTPGNESFNRRAKYNSISSNIEIRLIKKTHGDLIKDTISIPGIPSINEVPASSLEFLFCSYKNRSGRLSAQFPKCTPKRSSHCA